MKQIKREPRTNLTKKNYKEPIEVVEILSDKNIVLKDVDGTYVTKHIEKLIPANLRTQKYGYIYKIERT